MARYEIGDRVKAVVDYPMLNNNIFAGDLGTVCELGFRVGVKWDKELPNGHSCDEHCKYGHGWYVEEHEIELFDDIADGINEDSFLSIAFNRR